MRFNMTLSIKIFSLSFAALSLALSPQTQAQKSLSGMAYTQQNGSDFESYTFCPQGHFIFESSGVLRLGLWKEHRQEIHLEYNQELSRFGAGRRSTDPALLAANLPDYAYYPQYRYELKAIQSHQQSFKIADVYAYDQPSRLSKEGLDNCAKMPTFIEGLYPVASFQALEAQDLAGLNKSQLQIMRNEIFARKGLRFKTPVMQNHFAKQAWYQARFDNVDAQLSPLELKNIEIIKNQELRFK